MAHNSVSGHTPGQHRRLRQLLACLILFGLVFAGRGLELAPVERVTSAVSRWVGADTDFQAVFAQVGESFSRGEPADETLRTLWTSLLPAEALQNDAESETVQPDPAEGLSASDRPEEESLTHD